MISQQGKKEKWQQLPPELHIIKKLLANLSKIKALKFC